ncbi:CD3337/EF1877 family mobilome membrane protein [Enterococcus durans]|uniref:CD3337/EF1877 family mobilome membrane protein n=1 Tax=Enterococcus durans TaxID=53345 RepID=UPI0035689DB1
MRTPPALFSHKWIKRLFLIFLIIVGLILFLASVGTIAQAAGLVDETINANNEYSMYGLEHYQLDFYVDNSWDWLPWNWTDGLGKSVMYGLYAITNFIWTISLYLSNATGYLIQEAYSLDFISQTSDAIGKNIQTIAGISPSGFSSSGFYVGFLLILIVILGIYVAYTGILKRETTKAVRAILNFVVVFILSASFIAYAPDYIGRINDFSKDVSNASLEVGTNIVMPDSETKGKDSVDMIRDSLFSIQVKQPWLLLQYGSTDVDSLGADRIENLLSTSPTTNNGEDRETIVIEEIEDQDNTNLTITNTISRLGTVFFLFLFNIGISIFVFLLTGIMIFSQVLFIIFAMFLPVSFLLSMIPSFDGMGKRAITKLFNTIMARAGITLIITVAFSISTMLYSLSAATPFFMTMFLQIVTFGGIYFKLGDIMSLFALQSNDSQTMGRRFFRKPRMFMNRQSRKLQRNLRQLGKNSPTKNPRKTPTPAPKQQETKKQEEKKTTPKNQTPRNEQKRQLKPASSVPQKPTSTTPKKEAENQQPQQKDSSVAQKKDTPVKSKRQLVTANNDSQQSDTQVENKTTQRDRVYPARQRRQTIAQQRLAQDQQRKPQKKYPRSPSSVPASEKKKRKNAPVSSNRPQPTVSPVSKTANKNRQNISATTNKDSLEKLPQQSKQPVNHSIKDQRMAQTKSSMPVTKNEQSRPLKQNIATKKTKQGTTKTIGKKATIHSAKTRRRKK